MVARGLLFASLLFGCTRGYDDMPEGPNPVGWTEVAEGSYVYNSTVFHGNEVLGDELELTVCPIGQVMVGLDVYLHPAPVTLPKFSFTVPIAVPIAMVLRCAMLDENRNVGVDEQTKQIGTIPTEEVQLVALHCEKNSVVTTLRAAEDPWRRPDRWVSAVGIECANARDWRGVGPDDKLLDDLPPALPGSSGLAGYSAVGTEHFADTCARPYFVLNGLWGRASDRLEQLSGSCSTTPKDWAFLHGL